jgi:hypothetical protein
MRVRWLVPVQQPADLAAGQRRNAPGRADAGMLGLDAFSGLS